VLRRAAHFRRWRLAGAKALTRTGSKTDRGAAVMRIKLEKLQFYREQK